MQTAIFLKNQHLFAEFDKLLIVGQIEPALVECANSNAVFWGDSYIDSLPSEPAYMPPKLADVAALLIMLPKSRALLARLLSELSCNYAGKSCFLIGANNAGIAGAARQFGEYCHKLHKLDSARHCQLWQGQLTGGGNYQVADFCKFFSYQLATWRLELCTLAGVFNHGAIDAGTQLLLEYLASAPIATQRALDFGCGCGVLGIYLQLANPACRVDLSDISRAAIYASTISAALNKVAVNTILADGIAALAQQYDLIISNPAFHTGVALDYNISAEFFKNAQHKLLPRGQLLIVANKFLQYQQQLQQIFGNCQVMRQNSKFIVLKAIKTG